MHPFLSGLRPTLLIAHRGANTFAPENTLPAFAEAITRFRADMIETDVHVTKDGEVVISHDEVLGRLTDAQGAIAALTLAEVKRADAGYHFSPDGGKSFPFRGQGVQIPLLSEVLRAFPEARFNIEVKPNDPAAAECVAGVIRREGATARVCLGSEIDEMGERLVKAIPDACHFYPRFALTDLVLRLRASEPPPPDAPYLVLDMPLYYEGIRLVDKPFLERVSALGRWVNVWVVDEPGEMRALIDEGVGGIMTDRPDLLRRTLDGALLE